MQVFFRVDASIDIGTGHVFRCLTLANFFKEKAKIHFICRDFEGNLSALIREKGYLCHLLNGHLDESVSNLERVEPVLTHSDWLKGSQYADALASLKVLASCFARPGDCLFVDHFALSQNWEFLISDRVGMKIAVIDGQADRPHHCHLLVDPTLCNSHDKWQGKLPSFSRLLQGFPYIPIHPKFFKLKIQIVPRHHLKQVLVAFGGIDQDDFTGIVLQELLNLSITYLSLVVVVGQHYPHLKSLRALAEQHGNVKVLCQIDHIEDWMLSSDLAIGAGGTMAWERCMLGLPTLVAGIALNQHKQVGCLEELGVAIALGNNKKQVKNHLNSTVLNLYKNPERLVEMSLKAIELTASASPGVWQNILACLKGD